MKRFFPLLGIAIVLVYYPKHSFAQADFSDDPYFKSNVIYEFGASLGVMNCLTDLGGGKGVGKSFLKDLNTGNTEPEGSVFGSIAYKNALVLRTEMVWGVVKANDKVLQSVKESTFGRYDRNLSFRSTIFEVSLVTEIHPVYFKRYRLHEKLPRVSPYLLGGIGYFIFNPMAKLTNTWVELRPLHTEGQGFAEYPDRKEYKLKQINFPVGGGIKFKISEQVNFSTECVYRILNTDYLDDVSTNYIDPNVFKKYFDGPKLADVLALNDRQKEIDPAHTTTVGDIRGNPKKNDAYFSLNFKVAITF